ncbi:glycosyltransferase family protein [Pontibacter sp. E15-1]|uniref:glycosyltransferase n=1 Tax=Pontibacter sp. E15-1 TaxID=2919918 RepID=UPI001F4FD0DC|nr:glycosyltransferase [Pontibacter sp. E15-1]MCJ8166335.1 glycosyltransferase family protein [Pontibacter sp. E15-1]
MISIVVCSRSKVLLENLKNDIEHSIGVQYELIVIDNSNNEYDIFKAYNLGVHQCKGNIICFSHEDVKFHSKNWGQKVHNHFKDDDVGMIGVVGCTALPKVPAPWWNNQMINYHLINLIQCWGDRQIPDGGYRKTFCEGKTIDYNNPEPKINLHEAVTLDGLWFCIRKDLFSNISFDELTCPGFHCYDIDISLQVGQFKKVAVVYDILIEHFSLGTLSQGWFLASLAFNKKWEGSLPKVLNNYDKQTYIQYEIECLLTFAYWMQSANFNDALIKETIKYYLILIERNNSLEYSILKRWSKYGYTLTRFIIKINKVLNSIIKNA